MGITIAYSDLVHNGHSCIAFPYGIALVASYARKEFGDQIETDIFKYPAELEHSLRERIPDIVCFSNYTWNFRLSVEFSRRIKLLSPRTVVVFGGPNYPVDGEEQRRFFIKHPEIDFYVWGEGEQAFSDLLRVLMDASLDARAIRGSGHMISNCHYLANGAVVRGPVLPRLKDLDLIPSPFLTGLLDTCFDRKLLPMLQTTRGCPFSCTFCQDGIDYANKISRFSRERIRSEVEYMAQRSRVPALLMADLNFGMYPQDLEICEDIAEIQKQYGWPSYLDGIAGKNQKERVIRAASLIRGATVNAAIQSTDPNVLKQIKRSNISVDQMVDVARRVDGVGNDSFSEIILCLPGDTREAHFKSVLDMIDAGITTVRVHQLILLPGSDLASIGSRRKYGMVTRFREMPCTSDGYSIGGPEFAGIEIDEICVANNTLSFEEYLECRKLTLTVEMFYNSRIFQELFRFMNFNAVRSSELVLEVYRRASADESPVRNVYDGFVKENKELWETLEELEAFLRQPGNLRRYQTGELANNEQLKYRALGVVRHMEDLHHLVFDAARALLARTGELRPEVNGYLTELFEFSLLKKRDLFEPDTGARKTFHFDFLALEKEQFSKNPLSYYVESGAQYVFTHSPQQRDLITKYLDQYGVTITGIGDILSRSTPSSFFREVCPV